MAYSHSQLKVFDECALRFRLKYIDKVPEPQVAESPALKFWSIIHDCMEVLYKKIQNSGRAPALDELKTYFRDEMTRFRDQYDAVSELPFSPQDFDDRISLGQQMIERYYDQYAPFDQAKVNGLEQMISFELPNKAKFRGIIDRLDIKDGHATIVDYKTDKAIAPFAQFEESYQQQLTSYAVWVQHNYPHLIKSIAGKLIYLRLEEEVQREITTEMLDTAITKITDKIGEIEQLLFRYNMGEKDVFWPSEWYQCRRCAYQVMCPLRKHKFQDDEVVVSTEIWETTIKKLVDKFYQLNSQKKELEDQLKGIKEFLEEYVHNHTDEEWKKLYGEQAELRVDCKNEYKPQNAQKNDELKQFLLEHDFIDLLTLQVNTGKLTKYLKENPWQMESFASMIEPQEKVTVGWAKEKKEK